ncbi:MAG TPA: DNA methyltransferase, partial [Synergistaceae bacterium]|nr:DNA methyltransferase [Synergistaceae bacterium]
MKKDQNNQANLFETSPSTGDLGSVTCLGKTFPDDNARREHFLGLLREKLQDPEFRKIEGFPLGEDEAILALSDPPYYTACPNPWLGDFLAAEETPETPPAPPGDENTSPSENPSAGGTVAYRREPFAVDVSEGKTDPLYKAHSYHTKVPHRAIVPSILHYTEPGDVVLDGFCGSGMTGVAAQMCGDKGVVESLGYRVDRDGTISRQETDENGKPVWRPFSKIGARRAVLNDLSPAATFIAANYNMPFDVEAFASAGKELLDAVEQDLGWMYETWHSDGKTKGRIEYTVWSEVFRCPECSGEVNFLDEALDEDSQRVRDTFPCPHCGAEMSKKKLDRIRISKLDPATGKILQAPKRVPSLISYRVGKIRHEKKPDATDLTLLEKIEVLPLPAAVPLVEFPFADMWEAPRMRDKGITHTHHMFLPRAAQAMGALWARARAHPEPRLRAFLLFMVEQAIWGLSVLNRYQPIQQGRPGGSQVNRQLTGVYYVASQHAECSPWYILEGKRDRLAKAFQHFKTGAGGAAIGTGTAARLLLPENSIDYIFTDPPFGENLPYAELNFLVEAWLGVMTQAKLDAIVDRAKENRAAQKSVDDYRKLMAGCFEEYFRVLKPGRWITVAFSNTRAAVWNGLQTAMRQAGFVVANVSVLDKQQGSFKAVTTAVAVKQDLVISAYKPNGGLEERFHLEADTEEGVWDFVRTHLSYLPVVKKHGAVLQFVPERDSRILFDQMVAYYVRKGYPVPLDSAEFQEGLAHRFPHRDGMYFLPEQATEYDKKRITTDGMEQMSLFVSDESSAIAWLRQLLKDKPQTFQDIHPLFIKELGGWQKYEKTLELSELLEQNFLRYDGKGAVPNQIHSY